MTNSNKSECTENAWKISKKSLISAKKQKSTEFWRWKVMSRSRGHRSHKLSTYYLVVLRHTNNFSSWSPLFWEIKPFQLTTQSLAARLIPILSTHINRWWKSTLLMSTWWVSWRSRACLRAKVRILSSCWWRNWIKFRKEIQKKRRLSLWGISITGSNIQLSLLFFPMPKK